ncbi:restriction endonuclease subunit S [Marinobacter halotolerans]|uniref:restriction endonuclease subunit S n=1 Tax=Marinobacter halotolerans TaxID=1569211 RepID=UPI0012468FB4|nr:restriction endonuclease subunit S [Marinobacter halotolerans]
MSALVARHWPLTNLGSVVKFLSGGTPNKSTESYWNGQIPWVTSGEMTSERIHNTEYALTEEGARTGSRLVPKGTSFIVVRGMSLAKEFRVSMAMRDMAFNQDVKAVIPCDEFDRTFTYYYLKSQSNPIKDSASEAAHGTKKLDMAVLEQWPIPRVPLETQKKIAAVLCHYDDLIENNKRRITLLENMAEEIYREWFVRFRFPGWQEAGFEKGLPASWVVAQGDDLFEVVKGKSYSSEEISDQLNGGRPFINLKNFNRGGGYRSNGLKYFRGEFRDQQQVNRGDVVMAVTDMTQNREVIGRAARVPYLGETNGIISLDVVKISAFFWPDIFTHAHLRYSGVSEALKELANGANVLHLKPDLIGKQKYLVPDTPTVEKFVKLLEPVYEQIEKLEQQIDMLEWTKNQLLPRLISGKLSVENLDIQFPPSMNGDQSDSAAEAAA